MFYKKFVKNWVGLTMLMKNFSITFIAITFVISNCLMASEIITKQSQIEISDRKLDGLDEMVDKAMDLFSVPGVSVGIIIDGEIVLTKGYGFADKAKGLKVNENTLFAIGSCTKAFTTHVLGQLVDEGKISFNDPVIEYIPEFRLNDEYTTFHITIKDLVTHMSGLPRHDLLWYNEEFSRNDLLERLKYLDSTTDLRGGFQYNNLMYVVAGLVIERVTEMSWEEAVRTRIFTRVGMDNSNFSVLDSQKTDNYALPYTLKNNTLQSIPFHNIECAGPAGSINSTVVDMAKWVQLQLCDGSFDGKEFLNSEMLKAMHTPQAVFGRYPEGDLDCFGYGFGWLTAMYKGKYFVGHGGSIDGFVSFIGFLPKEKVGVIVLTNSSYSGGFAENLARAIFDRILGEGNDDWMIKLKEQETSLNDVIDKENFPVMKETGHPLNDYVGKFYHPGYGFVEVGIEEEGLVVKYGTLSILLSHTCYDNFLGTWNFFQDKEYNCTFSRDSNGDILEIFIPMEPSVDPIVFKKQ